MPLFRQRRSTEHTGKRRGNLVLLIVLALLVAVLTGGAQLWKADLVARSVRVEGNRIVPSEKIIRAANVPIGKHLEEVDLADIRIRVLKNPFFNDVSVHRDYPSRIRIRVQERIPVAAVVADRLYMIDAEGIILPPVRSDEVFDLPVITGAASLQTCTPGKRVSHPTVLEALEIVRIARTLQDRLYHRISEVHVASNGDLLLYTAEYGIPVTFGRGDVVNKLVLLEGFWNAVVSSRGANALRALDLRFADQVIARWDPSTEIVSN